MKRSLTCNGGAGEREYKSGFHIALLNDGAWMTSDCDASVD